MISYLEEQLRLHCDVVRTIKDEGEKKILHVRHKETGAQFFVRFFAGSADVYRELLSTRHPCLPVIYEAVEEDHKVLVIEEYVQGDSVAEMLTETTFNTKETRQIALDICDALQVLHSHEIVHRDVKPENILLRENHAVLVDLDASRIREEEKNQDTSVLGTVGYAAPEQFGISQTDGRADIYALGVTINQMLTGEHPSTKLASGRFGHIVSRCTMVHPKKRYHSVLELKRMQ